MDTADTTITSLWQQILAAPDNADLKVQYVDALAQAGDSREAMFRVANELHHLVHGYFEREAALTRQYESLLAPWRAEFDAAAQGWGATVKFVQGWPTELTIPAADFARHAPAIVATMPLRHLNLTDIASAPAVFTVAQLSQVASLNGSHQAWPQVAVTALADSPRLASLRWLDLSDTQLQDAQVETLAASPHLKQVLYINVEKNPCRDPADAAAGYGVDGMSGLIVAESIYLPEFGHELEDRYGRIGWLHVLGNFMEGYAPSRYRF